MGATSPSNGLPHFAPTLQANQSRETCEDAASIGAAYFDHKGTRYFPDKKGTFLTADVAGLVSGGKVVSSE